MASEAQIAANRANAARKRDEQAGANSPPGVWWHPDSR